MKIFLGSDHRGFELKNAVAQFLTTLSIEIIDCGPQDFDAEDDFNDYAKAVAKNVSSNQDSFGILICGSAQGVAMQANRFKKVRAAICHSADDARETRLHNNANILCLAADKHPDYATIIEAFLSTMPLTEEKYLRRVKKLDEE
ncbi:RpiB/LacA/LacB family sugar-phosphate isomerase [Candidatus Saccharibacteria bacterium]|nr:RpiB/LacA/LacB family sugar-phosphate isomerase [Candidatus Saccharibacteria bacterium]